jgi:hypothetical protein
MTAIPTFSQWTGRMPISDAPDQKQIDAESARLLQETWCGKHKWVLRRYASGEYGCPQCEYQHFLDHVDDLEPHPDYEPDERAV